MSGGGKQSKRDEELKKQAESQKRIREMRRTNPFVHLSQQLTNQPKQKRRRVMKINDNNNNDNNNNNNNSNNDDDSNELRIDIVNSQVKEGDITTDDVKDLIDQVDREMDAEEEDDDQKIINDENQGITTSNDVTSDNDINNNINVGNKNGDIRIGAGLILNENELNIIRDGININKEKTGLLDDRRMWVICNSDGCNVVSVIQRNDRNMLLNNFNLEYYCIECCNNGKEFVYGCYNGNCCCKDKKDNKYGEFVMKDLRSLDYHVMRCFKDDDDTLTKMGFDKCKEDGCNMWKRRNEIVCVNHNLKYDYYQCRQCYRMRTIKTWGEPWNDIRFKQYVKKFYCEKCKDNYGINTILQCNDDGCKDKDGKNKSYGSNRAITDWYKHQKRWHKDNLELWKMYNLKQCNESNCNKLVNKEDLYCINHMKESNMIDIDEKDQEISDKRLVYKDIEGREIYLNDLEIYINFDEKKVKSDEIKDELSNVYLNGLQDLANRMNNEKERIRLELRGLIKIKLIVMVYFFVSYRDADFIKIRNRRRKWLLEGKYKRIIDDAILEQNKINSKRDRKRNRLISFSDDDDEIYEIEKEKEIYREEIRKEKNVKYKEFIQDFDKFKMNMNEYKYMDNDNEIDIGSRIKRCIEKCKNGQWKKGMNQLDPTSLVDIYKNNNLKKAKSKFPKEMKHKYDLQKVKIGFDSDNVEKEILKINQHGCSGKSGINNGLLLWMAKHKDDFIKRLINLLKKIIEIGLDFDIKRILLICVGLMFGKEKNGIKDYDVRPILVSESLIRLMDKVLMACISKDESKELIGPYQLINQKQALEKACIMQNQAHRVQDVFDDLVMVNVDATNAYNSASRNYLYNILKDKNKVLCNWFKFLYENDNKCEIDNKTSINMESGNIQGLTSSMTFYSAVKWDVISERLRKTRRWWSNG